MNSCASSGLIERQETAKKIAEDAGFEKVVFDTGIFSLSGWEKITHLKELSNEKSDKMVVYIEGDGRAWESRYKISKDPTPLNPTALRLAVQEQSQHTLYLARPCQFIMISQSNRCKQKYWSSHRYSQDVINAYHFVLEQIKETKGINKFELAGFSGGGVIAALLAAQRKDVVFLTTVASNLDHLRWTDYHKVTPLSGSLDMYSFLPDLSVIPQYHLWGGDDPIVPFDVNKKLLKQLLLSKNVSYKVYDNFSHDCCWAEHWHDIQNKRDLK